MALEVLDPDKKVNLNLKFSDYFNEMREFANLNNVPIIQDEGLAFLETIVRIKRPKRILEIGCAIGYSASRMALASNATIYTIERDEAMYHEAQKNIKNLKLEDKVHIIFNDALNITNELDGLQFDMIFIDAAKGQSRRFFEKFEPYLTEFGVIVTDNMSFHGLIHEKIYNRNLRQLVRKINEYHEFLLNNESYDTSIYDLGDGMAVSIKK